MPDRDPAALDSYRDIIGVDFTPEELSANLAAFADILEAIKKLRALDLGDTHPAVIFDPANPYRGGGAP